jgi:uncharacterized protein involved in response to NO
MNIPASPMSAGSIPPRRRPVAAPGDRWRLDRLVTSPHRLGFATGAAMLSITAAWWLAVLAAGSIANITVPWTIAPRTAHAFAMTFAFVPMFFAGFLFTAGPRWLAQPPVAARALLPACLAWITGWIVFLIGAHANPRLAALGLAVVVAGWTLIAIRFARLVLASRAPDRTHPGAIAVACGLGAATLWLAAWSLATANDRAIDLALSAGRWWFIAPVFASAAHRMVPFFGVAAPCLDERHPDWLLWTWLATLAVQPLFDAALLPSMPAAIIDGVAAALVAWLAIRWARTQNLRVRLIAMLHAGFVWFGVALALLAVAAWNAGSADHLRVAALHALGMGFSGSTLLAFVTRVSAAQHGRTHSADDFVWTLFLVVQAAVALRITAAWLPAMLVHTAALWALATIAWSARHLRWYGRPREDGRLA